MRKKKALLKNDLGVFLLSIYRIILDNGKKRKKISLYKM